MFELHQRARARESAVARTTRCAALVVAIGIASAVSVPYTTRGAGNRIALPDVFSPFPGDARLEPIPADPLHLANIKIFTTDQFGTEKVLDMRFPPRVNGQNQSDGDKHADMYMLFDEVTGKAINQPMVVEAVPKGAADNVSDLKARLYSPMWELHAVTVAAGYDPTDPNQVIDSADKVVTSPLVKQIYQTNIFLNCPVVPKGTTVDAGSQPPETVLFEGQEVSIVPYDIEDGGFNVQILFKFEDTSGKTLGRPISASIDSPTIAADTPSQDFIPQLVASHALGDPFYTSMWDVWTVVVPAGTDVSHVRSNAAIQAKVLNNPGSGWSLKSSGIRLNCPVVAVDGVQVPIEDAKTLLSSAPPSRVFKPSKFPFDIVPATFTKSRTFQITEITPGVGSMTAAQLAAALAAAVVHPVTTFPPVTPEVQGKGNVIPLILEDPLLLNPANRSSGPATNGRIIHLDQAELDAAFADPSGPRLPAAIEANFSLLIQEGLLAPDWAPGGRPYQERLAAVGRAFFELFWMPEQGGNAKDVTTCLPCHSMPSAGASARGLYNLERAIAGANSGAATQSNPGSTFGAGSAQVMVAQILARTPGELRTAINPNGILTAHGSQGTTGNPSATSPFGSIGIRNDVAGASNTHFGVQSVEFIMSQSATAAAKTKCGFTPDDDKRGPVDDPGDVHLMSKINKARNCDLDGDGVVEEMTIGDVTAESVFLLTLAVPDEADEAVKQMLGISDLSVERGGSLFRTPLASGGLGCASCHTMFHKYDEGAKPKLFIGNTWPGSPGLWVDVPYHTSTAQDVVEGLSDYVGQRGLHTMGDFKRHELSATPNTDGLMAARVGVDALGNPTFNTTAKTAELWDLGSDAPLLRTGKGNFDIKTVILAHSGEAAASSSAFSTLSASLQKDVLNFLRVQTVQSKVGEGSGALPPRPVVEGDPNAPNHGVTPESDVFAYVDGTGKRTTDAFSTSSLGEVLVALVSADGPLDGSQQATVSGGGLTWTLVKRAKTQLGVSEVWVANANGLLTNVKISSTLKVSAFDQSLVVIGFRNASGIGAVSSGGGPDGDPTATLMTTKAGSTVLGVGNAWELADLRTAGSGSKILHQFVDTRVGDTFWMQSSDGVAPAVGTPVTITSTSTGPTRWNLAIVEVLPK